MDNTHKGPSPRSNFSSSSTIVGEDEATQKLREFMYLNAETNILHEEYQSRGSAVKTVGRNKYLARTKARTARDAWYESFKRLHGLLTELLQRDYVPVETHRDLDGLETLRESYHYGGLCGIRTGDANERSLRIAAQHRNFIVYTLPARQPDPKEEDEDGTHLL